MKTKNIVLIIILTITALGIVLYFRSYHRGHAVAVRNGGHFEIWYCPMHPWIKSDKPGVCPICGMALVPGHQHNETPAVKIPGYISVEISQQKQQLAGIRTAVVGKNIIFKTIRASGEYEAQVYAQVFENDLEFIKVGQKAIVEIPALNKKYDGDVINIDSTVDEASRTTRVRIWLNRSDLKLLKSNMFVDVELPVRLGEGVVVPRDAVMDTGLRKIVFVVKGQGQFEPREIQTGWETDDGFEVKSGLKEGERIVVNGNFLLDSESRVQAGLEDNNHV